jgi:hypothetical protein
MINEPTSLVYSWDRTKQELVIRGATLDEVVLEIHRVRPEHAAPARVIDPIQQQVREQPTARPLNERDDEFLPKGTTLDDPRLAEMERARSIRAAANLIRSELERNKRTRERTQV